MAKRFRRGWFLTIFTHSIPSILPRWIATVEKDPINGLYVAGSNAVSVMGQTYPSVSSIYIYWAGKCFWPSQSSPYSTASTKSRHLCTYKPHNRVNKL